MNELALFAGAGGGILGGHLLGWRTVCAVEFNSYAASVLCARQNDGILPPFPIWDDVRTFDGHQWRGRVDVVSGGFPCQDISIAGGGAGLSGERSGLWVEMARIIGEVRPSFVFVENSPMLTHRGLGTVLGDLAEMGFDAKWGVVSAADTGAPHLRERIWIVADTLRERAGGGNTPGSHLSLTKAVHGWIKGRPGQAREECRIPTPTVCGNYNRKGSSPTSGDGLATFVKMFPTPTVAMTKGSSGGAMTRKTGRSRSNDRLDYATEGAHPENGRLNPTWVEWLMGWPQGWTDLKPLAMGKFREWQQQHGNFSEVSE